MIAYIEDESGNFIVTDKPWLSNFYDYESYQAKIALNEKLKDDG